MLLVLCSARIFAALFVLPATSDQAIQGPVRNGMCLMLGFFVAWGQPLTMTQELTSALLAAMLLKEVVIGVMLGIAFSVVFWVAEGVGALIDTAAGFNNVQQTNPLSGQQSTPVSNLLGQLVISGFYVLGGMVVCVSLMFQSFRWWPLGTLTPSLTSGLEDFLNFQVRSYLEMTVKVAAPVMLILVLIDLACGLLAKTADKLEPNSLGQPIKGAIAILMLALLVGVFFDQAKPIIALKNIEADSARWASQGASSAEAGDTVQQAPAASEASSRGLSPR